MALKLWVVDYIMPVKSMYLRNRKPDIKPLANYFV